MTEPIAWVVSTARHNTFEGPALQLRVLCPLCRLIHTHNAHSFSDSSLGGRTGHCGKSRPKDGPVGYDLAWPDDAGARLLSLEMTQCHAILVTSGRQCSRKVRVNRSLGFYCSEHETKNGVDTRMPIDTSSIIDADREGVYTPKFDIVPGRTEAYEQISPKNGVSWDTERNG